MPEPLTTHAAARARRIARRRLREEQLVEIARWGAVAPLVAGLLDEDLGALGWLAVGLALAFGALAVRVAVAIF